MPQAIKSSPLPRGTSPFASRFSCAPADAARLASHDDLTSDVRVGALAGTTGEFRLLEMTGLVNAGGVLAAGVRIDTPAGTVIADGSPDYVITAAGESSYPCRKTAPPSTFTFHAASGVSWGRDR